MKLFRIVSMSAAVMLPQYAFATSTITGPALGTVQGIYDFCIKVDPADAASFRAQEASLVHDISPQTVSNVQGSSDYKRAYDSITVILGKIPAHDLAKNCAIGATPVDNDRRTVDDDKPKKRTAGQEHDESRQR
jgi:hypothetical protein